MDYVPVRVSTLRGDQKIPFELYIKIGAKHIAYIHKGDSFEGDRLAKLKKKKLRKMFITPDDEQNYRAYVSKNIEMAYDSNSGASIESRAQVVQGIQETNAEELMEDTTEENYNLAKDGASKYVNFLMKESDAIKNILNMENSDGSLSHSGVAASTYAVALAQELGVPQDQIELLALGCLIRDISLFREGSHLLKPVKEMSPGEVSEYKKHPRNGADQVKDLGFFDETVINIIHQHEECIDGSGFPEGLVERKMDPLAVIAATATAMDRIITFEGIPKEEAPKQLMMTLVGKHPLNHLQALQKIVKKL